MHLQIIAKLYKLVWLISQLFLIFANFFFQKDMLKLRKSCDLTKTHQAEMHVAHHQEVGVEFMCRN